MFGVFKSVSAALVGALVLPLAAHALSSAEYPSQASAGQCFARVLTPDVIEQVTEQIEVTPASRRSINIPAKYRTEITERLVRDASVGYRAIPAEYTTVTEEIMVEPEKVVLVQRAAKYEVVSETIQIKPSRVVWKKSDGLFGRSTSATQQASSGASEVYTGEVLCRVVEPAVMQTVRRTVMVEPPRIERRVVPAKYRTVTKQVVSRPASVEQVTIPAVYDRVPVDVMTEPARTEFVDVPAKYETITRSVVVAKGEMQWAEVLCGTNSKSSKIAEIQRALNAQTSSQLVTDGIFGPRTQAAMESFQRSNGFATGYLTVETVRALNIDPYI